MIFVPLHALAATRTGAFSGIPLGQGFLSTTTGAFPEVFDQFIARWSVCGKFLFGLVFTAELSRDNIREFFAVRTGHGPDGRNHSMVFATADYSPVAAARALKEISRSHGFIASTSRAAQNPHVRPTLRYPRDRAPVNKSANFSGKRFLVFS